jgi:hypothetical protein
MSAQRVKNSSKARRNQTKRVEQATKEAHTTSYCVAQYGAAPRSTMLREALYK